MRRLTPNSTRSAITATPTDMSKALDTLNAPAAVISIRQPTAIAPTRIEITETISVSRLSKSTYLPRTASTTQPPHPRRTIFTGRARGRFRPAFFAISGVSNRSPRRSAATKSKA
jgi:hypothetical protein